MGHDATGAQETGAGETPTVEVVKLSFSVNDVITE
jgi:hypothetical protein